MAAPVRSYQMTPGRRACCGWGSSRADGSVTPSARGGIRSMLGDRASAPIPMSGEPQGQSPDGLLRDVPVGVASTLSPVRRLRLSGHRDRPARDFAGLTR